MFRTSQKASLAAARQFNGKGVSNTILASPPQRWLTFQEKNTPFDQTVALGHGLIHARDFASGAVPQGSTLCLIDIPTPANHRICHSNYEYQTTELHTTTMLKMGGIIATRIGSTRQSMISLREEMYFHWKALGQEKAKAYLKNEKVVSEFHLADDLGKRSAILIGQKEHYDYQPLPLETG
ncbi:hypothetical protein OK016_17570 [Vibrio chagasii]|nr:hypothetical protein [Vibrio chagasii]